MDKDIERWLESLENRVTALMAEHTFPIDGCLIFGHRLPEKAAPEEKHIFKHSIKVDRSSLKLDRRIEALEKQRPTSKKKVFK